MTMLWIDGFDWQASADSQAVTALLALRYPTISNTFFSRTGRIAGFGMSGQNAFSFAITPILTNSTTYVIGFGYLRVVNNSLHHLIDCNDGGTVQHYIAVNSDNRLELRRADNSVLATGTFQFLQSTWYYLEFKVTVDNSSGSIEAHINGTVDMTASSLNTRQTSNNYCNSWTLRLENVQWFIDDLYILNTDGAINNDFLGDVQIQTIAPTGAGSTTDFTPSAGSNYQNVDEFPPNSDTDYNEADGNGDTDTYAFSNISTSAAVKAVQVNSIVRKTLAGTRTFANVTTISGTDYPSDDFTAADSYANYHNILEQNPDTSSDWLIADVNSAEFGLTVTN